MMKSVLILIALLFLHCPLLSMIIEKEDEPFSHSVITKKNIEISDQLLNMFFTSVINNNKGYVWPLHSLMKQFTEKLFLEKDIEVLSYFKEQLEIMKIMVRGTTITKLCNSIDKKIQKIKISDIPRPHST